MTDAERTYLEILSEGPKYSYEINEDARTRDYRFMEMDAAWRSLVLQGAVRMGYWSSKWRLTWTGRRLAEEWL